MRTFNIVFITFGIFGFLSCDSSTSLETEAPEQLVIQAYLYAGEPVADVRITQMLPLDADEKATATPVNDADIRLIKNGQSYLLEASAGDSGYYHYSGNDLMIETGDIFTLQVTQDAQLATAETIVPEAPRNANISRTSVPVPTFEDFRSGTVDPSKLTVEVTWENDAEDLYYVTVENIEENPTAVNSDLPDFGRRPRFIFPPNRRSEFRLNALQFTHYGTHVVKVYHVNQEYADLYDTQEQDSRDLNEPLTNINNGLGIFSAFHSNPDSLLLEVVAF